MNNFFVPGPGLGRRPVNHTNDLTGNLKEPWITRDAIDILANIVNPDSAVAEFGCGSSSLWFNRRAGYVISIEHVKHWFTKVKKYLQEYQLEKPNHKLWLFENDWDGYVSCLQNYHEFFDVILVDGRKRVKCIKNSYQAVKPGGYLILDNSDRDYYDEGINLLRRLSWKETITDNGLFATSIFKKNE